MPHKGYKQTEEHRQAIKITLNKPIVKSKMRKLLKIAMNKPTTIKKLSKPKTKEHKEKMKIAWMNPLTIKKHSAAGKKVWNSTSVKERMLIEMNKLEVRGRKSKRLKEVWGRPEIRERYLTSARSESCRKKKRIAKINYIKSIIGYIYPGVGKHETQILDNLEKELRHKILRNYPIEELGYFIDGYIPELNLAIEVDENHHYSNNELLPKDQERQREIEAHLKCNFLRIRDNAYQLPLIPYEIPTTSLLNSKNNEVLI